MKYDPDQLPSTQCGTLALAMALIAALLAMLSYLGTK